MSALIIPLLILGSLWLALYLAFSVSMRWYEQER